MGDHPGLWEEEWGRVERKGVRDEREARATVITTTSTQ